MKLWKIAFSIALLAAMAPALAAAAWPSHTVLVSGSGWAATATQAVPIGSGRMGTTFMTGRLSESVPLRIVVGLGMRDRVGAHQLLMHQVTPGDPLFHRFVTPAQFTALFNPTRAQAQAVAAYLQREGFTNVNIEPNNLLVTATGSPSRAEAAFHTAIRATVANGEVIYGNVTPAQVPAQLRGLVVAVLGLTNAYRMHPHIKLRDHAQSSQTFISPTLNLGMQSAVTPAHTPPPCSTVSPTGVCLIGIYGPKQYQVAYDACSSSCTGYNTSVAVMAEGNVSQVVKDLRYAETYWGLPQVPYTAKQVGVSSLDTAGLDEWDLDTQSSTGIAQSVKHLYVYYTTTLTDSDITLEYNHWVTDDLAQAGNSSFGEPETLAYADGSMLVDDEMFNQAASQGQTMFASTSDNGEGCSTLVATGVPVTGAPEPCYPAVSPYVVAVGGTTLDTKAVGTQPGAYYGEHAWVATGGGFSTIESAPYWQYNGIVPGSPVLATGLAARGIADISMCGDNNGCPMFIFVNEPGNAEVGGTSLSSPLAMGVWARLQTQHNNSLGFAAPVFYGVYGFYEPCPKGSTACSPIPAIEPSHDTSALPPDTTAPIGGFHDIIYAFNGVTTLPGWDSPTGLGTIDICVMQKDIANSIFSGH